MSGFGKALCPKTLRRVARWHEKLAEAADGARDQHAANGNYFAVTDQEGRAGAHRYAARKLRNDAASITRAAKGER
jgi:hypothetical protein